MDPIEVNGIPFVLTADDRGYVIEATSQTVHVEGSPVVIRFEPPIAPTIDLGAVYRAIQAQL
jgi:hypothetical protein